MACPHCHDTGWRPVAGDDAGRVERCECWRYGVARSQLATARIPPRYRDCDLESFVTYPNQGLCDAYTAALSFAQAFPVVDRGLLLIGPPGIGKTHIAVAVLRKVVLEKGVRGLYYDTRDLLSTIRATYNPVTRTSETDILRPVMQAELLVLDDLGAERPTDWVEETMNLVVNTRYNDRRPTIFTSNYEDTDADALDSLLVRVGFRMHSRLREMCEFLPFSGPDFRDFRDGPPSGEELARRWKEEPRRRLPSRATARARAQLPRGRDLGWSGGRAGG